MGKYRCTVCGKEFSTYTSCQDHEINYHGRGTGWTCFKITKRSNRPKKSISVPENLSI